MSEGPEAEEIHQAVDRTVEELLDAAGVREPPVDAIALAKQHLGLVFTEGRDPTGRGRKQAAGRPEASEEEQQLLAARAIGKHLRPDLLRRLGVEPEEARGLAGASLTNLFGDHLLTPARWFLAEARTTGYDLPALKQRFRTAGHELLAWRLLDLAEPCIITLIDNDHVHRRRSNGLRIHRELSEPEQRCQRYVHTYSRPHRLSADGWTVQGWPLHQADWKREVLRSVVEEA